MRLGIIFTLLVALAGAPAVTAAANPRGEAHQLMEQGNWKEALTKLTALVTDPKTDSAETADDLNRAVQCVANLGEYVDFDPLMAKAITAHPKNPRLLAAAAQSYLNTMHNGTVVSGAFERGYHRGGTARYVEVSSRDRVRALQLYVQSLPLLDGTDKTFAGQVHLQLADALLTTRWGQNAWALGALTDLEKLPDYEDANEYYGNADRGAPVDEKGDPLYHYKPATWEAAQNDGQRWRWTLARAAEVDPSLANALKHRFAQFLRGQFDVQTLAIWGASFGRMANDEKDQTANPFSLRSLGEDETLARLAAGPKRFQLPDEFNFIRIWKDLSNAGDRSAAQELGEVFENRMQYPRAATWYQKAGNLEKVKQLTGNWGTLETARIQPAGAGAKVDFRFRNAKSVTFTARAVDMDKLIADAKAYLKSDPRDMQHQRIDLGSIGYSLLNGERARYIGKQVAQWTEKLEPRPEHLDRRISITTPLTKGGAYYVEAAVEGGNNTFQVIWLTDLAIVKKTLDRKVLYYVVDATTGVPAANCQLDFFGYHTEWKESWVGRGQRMIITTDAQTATTDANGLFEALPGKFQERYTWLVTAKADQDRSGWIGWTGHGFGNWYDNEYNQQRSFFASDRPVYRPGHTAKFKFWMNQAQYDREGKSPYAGRQVRFQLTNPKGETIQIGKATLDDYGGGDGTWTIPADATLGTYNINIENENANGSIRVEEYKKPEFEVTVDAPGDPVMLGEKFTAKILAKYLFGAPVKEGKVKYKVTRANHDATWYPSARWDWYYGRGYWWFACDYAWYPGWFEWGCKRPARTWMNQHFGGWAPPQAPEIVAENEASIGEDGTVLVEIDTALAKATMGDTDHRYEISAEVTDASRRTIVGSGSVLVARKAFKVYAWLDHGHYRVGDDIGANFNAQTVDSKPVAGAGECKLFKLSYDAEGKVSESQVQTWTLPSGADGTARLQLKASEPGQYRLSYTVTDAKSHAIEGGYVFSVGGEGLDAKAFRFNDIELIADKKDYKPGDTLKLKVNADQADTTVLVFVRAANGVCQDPQVVKLKGKTATLDVGIVKKDMPNMFIEALTVSGAQVHQEMLEVVVPPEDRVLNVKVTPAAEQLKPGAKTKVTVELTQADGKPYVGSLLVTMYDKAVEYISGGTNTSDIRELFWKWRRSHHPQRETNLDRADGPMTRNNEQGMTFLGVFGQFSADAGENGLKLKTGGGGGRGGHRPMMRMSKGATLGEGFGGAAPEAEMAMDAAAPMASGNVAGLADMSSAKMAMPQSAAAPAPAPPPPPANAPTTIRQNFADTAFWGAAIQTDANGKATVDIDMPESLTTWKTRVWAMGDGCRVGQADTQVITSKNVLVRLQAPRFFVEKDEVVLSANVHNYLKTDASVQVVLELEGGTLEPLVKETTKTVQIKSGGEARVDWRVRVTREGKAVVRMKALTTEESDAMQMEFPVLVHGMLKVESFCGVIRPEASAGTVKMNVPAERKPEQSRLEIRYSPTLAMAMVDALPYLVEYPYGCTEQTLNRFLPTVLTQKVLLTMGVKLKDVSEKITNLNAQEIGDDQKRSADWKRLAGTQRWDGMHWVARNPVFEEAVVTDMIRSGVERIVAMQCSDGGWGWFSGYGEHSSAHTTALVVHGLLLARFDDAKVPTDVLRRGLTWLKKYELEELRKLNLPETDQHHKSKADALDAFVSMVLAESKNGSVGMRERLYKDRNDLPVYAKAMLGLTFHRVADTEKRDMVIRNIDQFLVEDAENQTAYLKLPQDYWWYWYGSEYEAQAYYLKLLAAAQPKSEKASRLVKYLLNNRRNATYWNSTRDTAIVIEAFADYIAATGEDKPDMSVEILIDGKSAKTVKISGDNLFTYDNKLVLTGTAVTTGAHTVELKKTGTGPLYWNAYLTNFTQEDHITKAGLEVKVERAVYKLVREDATRKVAGDRGQVLEQKVEKYKREALADGATLKSGDLVEVELTLESKNDYEYMLLEDPKAAGFEATEVKSGYNGNDMGAYVEFRDQKVCFFVRELARGKHSVSYRLRAEIPGAFSALPTKIGAMYAPELKGNSDEIKLKIED